MKRLKEWMNANIESLPELFLFMGAMFGIQTSLLLWVQRRFKNDTLTGIVAMVMFAGMMWAIKYLSDGNN